MFSSNFHFLISISGTCGGDRIGHYWKDCQWDRVLIEVCRLWHSWHDLDDGDDKDREKETLWMGRGADWGVSWTTQLTSFNFVIGHCEDHSVSAEITKQHKIILHVSIYALWEFIHKHRKSAKLLWHHVRLKI